MKSSASDFRPSPLRAGSRWLRRGQLRRESAALALAGCFVTAAFAADQPAVPAHRELAPTPPMGWNSFDCFVLNVTEAQVKAQTDVMASKVAQFGWSYIVVDHQWYNPTPENTDYTTGVKFAMDEHGRWTPAANRFPSGMKALANYVHERGLKFGLHLMRGIPRQAFDANTPILGTELRARDIADPTSTCTWNADMYGVDMSKPGAQAYYDSVFQQFAEWGLDFVKVDDLSRPYATAEIEAIRKAIDKTGRPMILSTSPGATPLENGGHVAQHANMWRISDDFWDRWQPLYEMFERLDHWTPFRTAGAWPDADMLPFGILEFDRPTRFTHDDQTLCMTLWCIARSPLIFGGDLTRLDDFTLGLLTNPEVIAVNQASTNNRQLSRRDDLIVWVADVPDSRDRYVALFNAQDASFPYDFAKAAYRSPVIRGEEIAEISVPLNGTRKLALIVADSGDNIFFDHGDWIEPVLTGPEGTLDLTTLKWKHALSGYGEVRANLSSSGKPIQFDGRDVKGLGTHAPSIVEFDVPVGYDTFRARGMLSRTRPPKGGSVEFLVLTDSARLSIPEHSRVSVSLADLGLDGEATVRDLWKRDDLGTFDGEFGADLPLHGAGLYRVSPVR